MRYRPFNQAGLAVSAITLALEPSSQSATNLSEAKRMGLVFAALEAGINSFELAGLSPDWHAVLRSAIEAAGRNVLVLTLRAPNPKGEHAVDGTLNAQVRASLEQIGVERFDALVIEDDGAASTHTTAMLHAVREQGLAGLVGVACGRGGPSLDILQAGYGILATPFGLQADAGLRKRLRTVVEHNVSLIGCDFCDMGAAPALNAEPPKGLARLFKRPAVAAGADPYEFLHRTPSWTAEEIALAYALTEPSLATVRVQTTDISTLERLAKAVERELPTGSAAQIEMARFSAPA
jgi:aryl-alcohol dehydrogenase-like predicted oxidoreductase